MSDNCGQLQRTPVFSARSPIPRPRPWRDSTSGWRPREGLQLPDFRGQLDRAPLGSPRREVSAGSSRPWRPTRRQSATADTRGSGPARPRCGLGSGPARRIVDVSVGGEKEAAKNANNRLWRAKPKLASPIGMLYYRCPPFAGSQLRRRRSFEASKIPRSMTRAWPRSLTGRGRARLRLIQSRRRRLAQDRRLMLLHRELVRGTGLWASCSGEDDGDLESAVTAVTLQDEMRPAAPATQAVAKVPIPWQPSRSRTRCGRQHQRPKLSRKSPSSTSWTLTTTAISTPSWPKRWWRIANACAHISAPDR